LKWQGQDLPEKYVCLQPKCRFSDQCELIADVMQAVNAVIKSKLPSNFKFPPELRLNAENLIPPVKIEHRTKSAPIIFNSEFDFSAAKIFAASIKAFTLPQQRSSHAVVLETTIAF
jgi:hypothetical protein